MIWAKEMFESLVCCWNYAAVLFLCSEEKKLDTEVMYYVQVEINKGFFLGAGKIAVRRWASFSFGSLPRCMMNK